jgi:hypothetical protein
MALTKVSYSMITGAPFNVLDYGAVGDGVTNDAPAIQDAIDAAEVLGGVVYLPANTYLMSAGVTVPSNVSIQGDGVVSELKRDVAATPFDFITIENGATHIGLYDFYINGVAKLDNGTVSNRYCGIRVWANGGDRPNDIEIVGVHVDKTTSGEIQAEGNRAAVLLEDCYDIRMSRCKFYDNRATAILITVEYGQTAINTERVQIEQCYGIGEVAPFDPDFPNGFGSFISGNSHQDVLVSGCYVDGFGFSNISMNGPRSTVENCISVNSNYAGINLGHATPGEQCDQSVVVGNSTKNNKFGGIVITASSDVVVSSNVSLEDGTAGAWGSITVLYNSDYDVGETTNVTIANNQIVSSKYLGIYSRAGSKIHIVGNMIADSTSSGVLVTSQKVGEVTDVYLSDNVLIDNGGTGNAGVQVSIPTGGGYGSVLAIVKDNFFYSSDIATKQRWGIVSSGDTTAVVQVNNNWFSSGYNTSNINKTGSTHEYALNQIDSSSLSNANIGNAPGVSGGAFTTVARNAIVVTAANIGMMVFDTTLGKPVWLKNNSPLTWVDGAGTTV